MRPKKRKRVTKEVPKEKMVSSRSSLKESMNRMKRMLAESREQEKKERGLTDEEKLARQRKQEDERIAEEMPTGVPSAQGLVLKAKEMEKEMDKAAKEFKRKIAEGKKKKGKH